MNDSELLKKYEPVLRFAKSERFFPMAVEPYLEKCTILPSGPQGVMGLVTTLSSEPLVTRIGKLQSGEYYLRFVNDPLIDADIWIWWAVLSAAAASLSWLFLGRVGVEGAGMLCVLAALIIFIQASPIRARFFPAALVALGFSALEVIPIWFFLRPHTFISTRVEYLVLLPLYVFTLFYAAIRSMKFIFDYIIPEAPGVIMDMLSNASETVARKAYRQYQKILAANPQPVYYGRVTKRQDNEGNHWTSLQYHFFYAFNDWRFAAHGVNHHEGDWEMVAVYLKNDEPYVVLFSQHGSGALERWANIQRAKDQNGNETTHPIIYVALGSHANYSKPDVMRSSSLYHKGFIQRLIYWIDGLIHFIFLLFNPSERARQIALSELAKHPVTALSEKRISKLRDERDHYVVSLPLEIATGDGFRIGCKGDIRNELIGISSSYLKRALSDREVTRPATHEWKQELLNPEPGWVQYKGLWGVKSPLREESGPPGPKWDRPDKLFQIHPRKRWDQVLEWLMELQSPQ